MFRALSIAGSDCSGGAGIQADLKTFSAFGVFGMSAITAVVAENTVGVQGVFDIPLDTVTEQIKSCVTDIGVDAVKIGMLSNPRIVMAVANCIDEYKLPNVVLDPVMVAKSGDPLLTDQARESVREYLLPRARIITPNKFEAEVLLGHGLKTFSDFRQAAHDLHKIAGELVVVKGGHLKDSEEAIDLAYDGKTFHEFCAPFFDTPHTHGTGCTFSSAIAAGLARGREPIDAIKRAKEYISRAIQDNPGLGRGHGPTNHLVDISSPW